MECSSKVDGLHSCLHGFARLQALPSRGALLHPHPCILFLASLPRSSTSRRKVSEEVVQQQQQQGKGPKLFRTWDGGVRVVSGKQQQQLNLRGKKLKDSCEWEDRPLSGSHATTFDRNSGWNDGVNQQPPTSQLNCQHFSRCSGCFLENELQRPPVFKDALKFFCSYGIRDVSLTTCNTWEWRCRAKLAVQGTADHPLIGLYEEGTHNVVDIPACRAHHPSINAAINLLKAGIREVGVQPYMEESGQGELRYVQMAVTTYSTSLSSADRYANGKVQVTLVWNARSEHSHSGPMLRSIAEFLWRTGGPASAHPLLHSIWVNFQTSKTNVIFGGRWRHLFGEQQCWERLGGIDICLMPYSFAQANIQAFEVLLRKLQKHVVRGSAVVELYAGVGLIGLSLAATRSCRTVRCVEVNKDARKSFEFSLARLPKSNRSNISWHCADVSMNPISWLRGSDVVIVDPPRKGLHVSVIEALRTASLMRQGKRLDKYALSPANGSSRVEKRPWILRMKKALVDNSSVAEENALQWPNKLIYVSCGWEAFKSDCAALTMENAWDLEAVEAFNLFPGTDSIEVLAIFTAGSCRKGKKKKLKD